MSFILLFLLFSQALSQTLSCLFTPEGTGLVYDLQALYRSSAFGDYLGNDGTNSYVMNVCGFATSGGTCTAGYGTLCQFDASGNYLSTLAYYSGTPRWTWDLISPASPTTGVKITYMNGDNCTSTQAPYSVVMNFYCQPDAPFGNSFTIQKTDACSYSLSVNSPNACPEDNQVLRLISKEVVSPATPQTQGQGFSYWSIDVDSADAQLNITTVQVAGVNTTLEVYVRANAKPTDQTFDRRDVSGSSIHMIQIRTDDAPQDYPLSTGTYYIGVRAYGPNAVNYTLQATLYPCLGDCSGHGVCNAQTMTCTCDPEFVTNEPDCSALIMDINNGQPVTGLIMEDGLQYWRFDDTDSNAYQFFINMDRSPFDGGDALPTLFIRKNDFPTYAENDGMVSDFSIPSQTWSLEVNGSLLTTGYWIIGVQGSQDTTFMYSLTASIFDCDKNCSNHGTCDPVSHKCTCDPNWATDDCSLSQMNLPFNMWTQQSVGPDSIGYFVAGVPDELASRPVDLLVRVKADPNLGSDYYPRIYIGDDQEPDSSTYAVTSAMPPAPDQQLRVSYTLLSPGEWFIGIVNLAPATANYQILLSFEGQCLPGNCSGHGSCNLTVCSCNDGWEGGACDVETQGSSNNVATGTVVALVFVFLILGTAVGILVMRQWPQLCSKSARESLVDTEES